MEALNVYLDQLYMSCSCAIWEDPNDSEREDLLGIGSDPEDELDGLEKAQWRKSKDAVDFIDRAPGKDPLDVWIRRAAGCSA